MTAPYTVAPIGGPVDAAVELPGSKSITNRALLAAALAPGTSRLAGALSADDTEAMMSIMGRLGARIDADPDRAALEIEGVDGRIAPGPLTLDARQSGTTARFVLPVLATGRGEYVLDGDAQLRRRPMGPGIDALRTAGAGVAERGDRGRLPVAVTGGGLRSPVEVEGDVSSQFLSGLLLAGPLLPDGLTVRLAGDLVSRPYVELTISVMAGFGVDVVAEPNRFVVPGRGYRAADLAVEPDASAASYFLAAAAVCGGRVTVPGLGPRSRQGDVGFADVLARMGAEVAWEEAGVTVGRAPGSPLRGIEVDLSAISDTAPTLAVVAALAEGPTRVTGIGFIRAKETDRVAAVVRELRRCGVEATEEDDGFSVRPGGLHGAVVQPDGDHRMAMAFAVLGLAVTGISIADPGCVAKTFPGFWSALESLRRSRRPPLGTAEPPRAVPHGSPTRPGRGTAVGSRIVRVIAIDGPAGSGKSTVARMVAERLGLDYLDTGAMYRGVAFAALHYGIDPADAAEVAELTRRLAIVVGPDGVLVGGVDATIEIRGPEVTRAVSIVAANPAVRTELRDRQREWAKEHGGGVVEGRDIGTVVFPEAELKVFLTAQAEVRADRRATEVTDMDYETVAADLARRDAMDEGREAAPLARADDAVVIDTTGRSIDDVVAAVLGALDGRPDA